MKSSWSLSYNSIRSTERQSSLFISKTRLSAMQCSTSISSWSIALLLVYLYSKSIYTIGCSILCSIYTWTSETSVSFAELKAAPARARRDCRRLRCDTINKLHHYKNIVWKFLAIALYQPTLWYRFNRDGWWASDGCHLVPSLPSHGKTFVCWYDSTAVTRSSGVRI